MSETHVEAFTHIYDTPTAQVLVISCSQTRISAMKKQLKELNMPFPAIYFEASTPSNSVEFLPKNIVDWYQRVVSCTRSHIRAITAASQPEAPPYTIILEDDASLHKEDFYPVIKQIIHDWETGVIKEAMVNIGWTPKSPLHVMKDSLTGNPYVHNSTKYQYFSKKYFGTMAYIVRRDFLHEHVNAINKPTFSEFHKTVTEGYKPVGVDIGYADNLFPVVFGNRRIFPTLAIEQIGPSLINFDKSADHKGIWDNLFRGNEEERTKYWTNTTPVINNIQSNHLVFAILAKNKAAVLPLYLKCLLSQTVSKKQIHLYIRTNDNTDNTTQILQTFVQEHGSKYASVFFDYTNVSSTLTTFKNHEWNPTRFEILGRIRQESVDFAKAKGAHYFVADCDNFFVPNTLDKMLEQVSLGVIAPMLVTKTAYSNYHYDVDANGYLKPHPNYLKVLNRAIMGCVEVKVVHCTYFVAHHQLKNVCYDDKSARYEYVIFSDTLRKKGVPQYLDNHQYYGFLTFADTTDEFERDITYHANALTKYFSTTHIMKNVIPKIIHQIWVGPKPIPTASIPFITDIRRLHPDHEYRLWTDIDVTPENFKNYSYIMNCKSYAQKADLMRYEILYNNGGIYLDIDFELFQSLSPLLTNELIVCNEDELMDKHMSIGFIACTKQNEQLLSCVNKVKDIDFSKNVNIASGPAFFRKCINLTEHVSLLPTSTMYPTHYTDPTKPFVKTDKIYGCHHWNKMW